jgi:hypothetical protein
MTRHQCRYGRTKLSAPIENPRRAFCCRGCFNGFYRPRCVVCETPIRRKIEWQKTCIAKNCKAEIKRFPLAYSWPCPQNYLRPPSKAHLVKFGLAGGATRLMAICRSITRTASPSRGLRATAAVIGWSIRTRRRRCPGPTTIPNSPNTVRRALRLTVCR